MHKPAHGYSLIAYEPRKGCLSFGRAGKVADKYGMPVRIFQGTPYRFKFFRISAAQYKAGSARKLRTYSGANSGLRPGWQGECAAYIPALVRIAEARSPTVLQALISPVERRTL